MDRNVFDALVRGFGTQRSRRAAVKGFAGGIVGLGTAKGAAAQVGVEARTCREFCTVESDCNFGFRCGEASRQCFAVPSSRTRCNGNADCPSRNEVCGENNRCVNQVDCIECRRAGDCPGTNPRCRDGRCVTRR